MDVSQINRLSQDEIIYEIECRGLLPGTVEEMRKSLRATLKLERRNSFLAASYPFTFDQDSMAVEKKLVEIGKLLENPPKSETSGDYLKILTKVEWCLRRLDRSIPENESQDKAKLILKNKVIMAMAVLDGNEDDEEDIEEEKDDQGKGSKENTEVENQRSAEPQRLETSRVSASTSTNSGETGSRRDNVDRDNFISGRVYVESDRFQNIAKWDVKFTGERCGASVNAFLERVEEMRQAKGVSETQLFRAAVELFVGKALIWFRAVRVSINSWQELVKELKLEFLPPNYDDQLLEEIRRRTQGKDESIGVYVATMQNLFGRLTEPISEGRRLSMIQRNLTPFYQTQLGLANPTCVSDLVKLGRSLEAVRANVDAYVPPPSVRQNRTLLEPDLAYVGVETPSVSVVSGNNGNPRQAQSSNQRRSNSSIRCFNCNGSGHYADRCSAPRRCYGCGALGVKRPNCRTCSGNGNRTSATAGQEVQRS